MQRLFYFVKTRIICFGVLLLALSQCAMSLAATDSSNTGLATPPSSTVSTNQLLLSLSNYIVRAVNAAVQTHQNLLYQPTFGIENTIAVNAGQNASQSETRKIANQAILRVIKLLVTTSDNTKIVNAAANRVPYSVSTLKQFGPGFSLNSFIDVTNLDGNHAKNAENFIAFFGGTVKPHEVLDPKDMLSPDLENVPEYKVQLGISTVRNGTPLDTLYTFLSQRIPQAGLGKLAGITVDDNGQISFDSNSKPLNDASALMVKQFNVAKRFANPKWYQAMEAASPATIQREILYVLAHIDQSLFDSYMLKQREMVLLAQIALQQSEPQQKAALKSDAEAVANARSIKGAKSPFSQ